MIYDTCLRITLTSSDGKIIEKLSLPSDLYWKFKAGSLKSLWGVPWGKSIHGIYLLFYFTINFWPVDLPPVFGCSSWPVLYKPKCLQKSGDM